MCILSYLPPFVPVDEDGLFNGGLSNPDGHGWAVTTGDTILVGKSLDLVTALDEFKAARAEHPGGHALFHSRWATHGSVSTDNVHPFLVGGSERTVVAHNGILPGSAHPAKGDDRSDTRLFADEILSTRYRRLNRERVRESLTNWVGTGNKLVILTVDPRYRRNAYLINEKRGVWDKPTGIWHSNYDFETVPWWLKQKGKGNGYAKWSDWTPSYQNPSTVSVFPDPCFYCHGSVTAGGYCTVCGTCQDCLEPIDECFCYAPVAELPVGQSDSEPNPDDQDGTDPGDEYVYYAHPDEDVPVSDEGVPTIG